MALEHGTLLTLALLTSLSLTACDEVEDIYEGEMTLRSGGSRSGGVLTMNTNKWVSSSARDVYEFADDGSAFTNSFGYESQLTSITVTDPNTATTNYGTVTTTLGEPPPANGAWAEIAPGDTFTVRIHGPAANDPVVDVSGADLLGLELDFEITDQLGNEYSTLLEATDHSPDALAGDLFEFYKVDPTTGAQLAPLCALSEAGGRSARITTGLSIDGDTGALDDSVSAGLRHVGCCASAPAKAVKLGYNHLITSVETFAAVTRVVRADYCADGHPYTFPGNMVGVEDNIIDPSEDPNTTFTNVSNGLAVDEVIEAVWDEDGVLCVGTPRAANITASDIICPTKHFADGSIAHNWTPPNCSTFVDANPNEELRIYSKTSLPEPEA